MDTIAICDTEPIAIEGLRSLLDSAEGLRLVATESSLAECMDAVRDVRPSLLVLDKGLGILAVMDALKELRLMNPSPAVIVWGAPLTEVEALRLLQAGARAVIRKTSKLDLLLRCLRKVACGVTWMDEELVREAARPRSTGHSPLTAREMQVMELVERGMKNKDIGETLGIRTGTVKIHLKHIFEKTGVRGRYGLALTGLKEKGLLVPALLEIEHPII